MLVYVHIPFCKRKCGYCNFCSYTSLDGEGRYVDALLKEIDTYAGGKEASEAVKTIYFGGGTPSVLTEGNLGRILEKLKSVFHVEADAEISAEGNPESLTEKKLDEWKQAGVNRVSIGVQSFDDDVLKASGRLHTGKDAEAAVKAATERFFNVSCDLISGLPGQTQEIVKNDVLKILNNNIKHVSCYGLKLEKGTPLYESALKKRVVLPTDDEAADMFDLAMDMLEEGGFKRYEVSNFCKTGCESRHNLGYWKRENYVGLGAAAAGLFEDVRSVNVYDLEKYISMAEKGAFKRQRQRLSKEDALFEEIMLGLRLTEGISVAEIEAKFSIDFEKRYEAPLKKYATCFEGTAGRLGLNRRGFEIMNAVLTDFLD